MLVETIERKIKDRVSKSNTLVEASINLSLVEARLLEIVFAEITGRFAHDEKNLAQLFEYQVSANEFSQFYKMPLNGCYEAMKHAVTRLFHRSFTYYSHAPEYPSDELMEVHKVRWVIDIGYSDNLGYVTMQLHPAVISLVGQFESKFTAYNIANKVGLNSSYAFRLYDIFKQYEKMSGGTFVISVNDLRSRLGIEEGQYTTMSNFKRVVLDPAVSKINESEASDIEVKYKQIKHGKTITDFQFIIKPKVKNKPNPNTDTAKTFTQKQADYFANLLANDGDFGSNHARTGESLADFKNRIANDLQRDTKMIEKYMPCLLKHGYVTV